MDLRKHQKECVNAVREHFVNWEINLTNVVKYIDENNKRPSRNNNDKNIEKMRRWIVMQTCNYNNKKGVMKQQKIREQWEEFVTEYQEYFPDNPAIKEKKPAKKSTLWIRRRKT